MRKVLLLLLGIALLEHSAESSFNPDEDKHAVHDRIQDNRDAVSVAEADALRFHPLDRMQGDRAQNDRNRKHFDSDIKHNERYGRPETTTQYYDKFQGPNDKKSLHNSNDFYRLKKYFSRHQRSDDMTEHYRVKNYKKWSSNKFADDINFKRTEEPNPPDHKELIPMARYVLHNSDWASIATLSVLKAIEGFPFSNVKSVVDGTTANSTGVPYFYMSPLDFTSRDLARNNRATVLVSLEETKYCEKMKYDPEDPRCTRLMLSGKMKKVKAGTPEYQFAKAALFERHPAMADFPPDHDWFIAKLKIAQIAMVDWFGGAKYISVKDYLAYNYTVTDHTLENVVKGLSSFKLV